MANPEPSLANVPTGTPSPEEIGPQSTPVSVSAPHRSALQPTEALHGWIVSSFLGISIMITAPNGVKRKGYRIPTPIQRKMMLSSSPAPTSSPWPALALPRPADLPASPSSSPTSDLAAPHCHRSAPSSPPSVLPTNPRKPMGSHGEEDEAEKIRKTEEEVEGKKRKRKEGKEKKRKEKEKEEKKRKKKRGRKEK